MSGLQGFLGDEEEEGAPAPEAREPEIKQEPEPQQAAPEPNQQQRDGAELEKQPEGELQPQQPERPDARQVPVAALEAERRKRQEREAEAADLRRQLEAFQRQQQPQQPPQREMTDEERFFARVREEAQQAAYQTNREQRFYQSEMAAVRKYGAEAVQAAADQFLAVRKVAPQVQVELDSQADPIGWLVEQSARVREVGEFVQNGEGFRAKIEAELRAKWEAEAAGQQQQQQQAPQRPAVPRQQPSLAGVRSVAGRAAEDEGDESIADILRR